MRRARENEEEEEAMGAKILDPTGTSAVATEKLELAPRPADLKGRTVALVDNGKQNANVFVAQLKDELVSRYGVGEVLIRKKPIATVEAPTELLQELAEKADVVMIGVGDCGSCSAAAIADGISLERLGTPTSVVCTESFKATADAMAALKGAPGYRYATCEHPVAGLDAAAIHERVESVLEDVVGLVTSPAAERGAA
jgi:hypothetical protein